MFPSQWPIGRGRNETVQWSTAGNGSVDKCMPRGWTMSFNSSLGWKSLLLVSALSLAPVGCQDVLESVDNKAEYRLPKKLVNKMKAQDQRVRAPILIRIFKQEGVLEVWKARGNGRYALVKDYEICKWSGKLGPKFKEGDRQAPEGYYDINPYQMNPKSSYYLSFNMGYPNRYDRAHGRTGSNLMVHGACSSAGCYSMTDEQVLEIYAFAREAFRGGQTSFQVQAYPFRMTAENMAAHSDNEHFDYWQMIKVGYDHFELTKRPPKVDICDGKYVFNQIPEDGETFHAQRACPPSASPQSLQLAYAAQSKRYDVAFTKALEKAEKNKKPAAIAPPPETAAQPQQSDRQLTSAVAPASDDAITPVPTPSPANQQNASNEAAEQSSTKKSWWKVW